MAKWSSSYDCIEAQMNGRTERVIYEQIVSKTDQTYESQICKNNNKYQ